MKAIACPRCGALIKKISLKEEFADCDYCEAKILLSENKDKIVEISDKKLTPWDQYRENHRKIEERTKQNSWDIEETNAETPRIFGFVIFGVIALIVVGVFVAIAGSMFASRPKNIIEKTEPSKVVAAPTVQYPKPTPAPRINYQVKVQFEGANDMEHFEDPQIENEKLPTFDEVELKKTVFKNRGVQVKVTIDTTGEVISAEGISGHPILKESAVNSAKKSLFNPRSKPTTRILTYYFRLITE